MIALAEGLALFFLGLVVGILSALADVLFFGSASFVAHFALWALLNALVAIHVDSRLKAIWWAIPFNLGYIECYYLCTSASFEGYARSMLVTLAGMAFVSPFLTYGLWTAKRQRGFYGKLLSILISGGLVAASYYLFGRLDVFSIIVAVILLFVLLFWPARRLKFTRAPHPQSEFAEEELQDPRPSTSARRSSSRAKRSRIDYLPTIEPEDERSPRVQSDDLRATRREPTRRQATTRRRSRQRDDRERERERDAQRRVAAQRRARRQREREQRELEERGYRRTVSTLGTSRAPRPSRRSR